MSEATQEAPAQAGAEREPVPCDGIVPLLAYQAGRADAFYEAADMIQPVKSPPLAGLTEQEQCAMRTVHAVLCQKAAELRRKATE